MCYFPGGFIFSHGACSIDDCKAGGIALPKPIEELQNSVRVFFGGIVAKIKEILKKWFDKVFDFFSDMLKEGYKTVREMFKGWFQKHRIQQDVFSHLTETKWAALFLLSSFTFSHFHVCQVPFFLVGVRKDSVDRTRPQQMPLPELSRAV